MRKIEQAMGAAIRAGRNWSSGNTMVDRDKVDGAVTRVWLHGNLIATLRDGHLKFTLAGWPTPTTRSRINALLREFANSFDTCHGVGQCKGAQEYRTWSFATGETLSRQPISATQWVQA